MSTSDHPPHSLLIIEILEHVQVMNYENKIINECVEDDLVCVKLQVLLMGWSKYLLRDLLSAHSRLASANISKPV